MLALGIPSRSVHLRLSGALLSGLPSPALGTPGRALPSAVGVAEAQSPGSSLGLGVLRGPGLTSPPSKQAAAQEGVRAWARAVLGRLPCPTDGQRSSPPTQPPWLRPAPSPTRLQRLSLPLGPRASHKCVLSCTMGMETEPHSMFYRKTAQRPNEILHTCINALPTSIINLIKQMVFSKCGFISKL